MTESLIEEIHRVRRDISDRFDGDISRIADDAAARQADSSRPVWQPKSVPIAAASAAEIKPTPQGMSASVG